MIHFKESGDYCMSAKNTFIVPEEKKILTNYFPLELQNPFYVFKDSDTILIKLHSKPISGLNIYADHLPDNDPRNEENLSESERKALHHYTTSAYKIINLKLLSGKGEYDTTVHRINRAIINAFQLDLPSQCYRVVQLDQMEYEDFKVGTIYYTSSFTSTSREVLNYWSGNTLYIIHLVKGRRLYACDVAKLSEYSKESEILLALNAPLKVIKKSSKKRDVYYSRKSHATNDMKYDFMVTFELCM